MTGQLDLRTTVMTKRLPLGVIQEVPAGVGRSTSLVTCGNGHKIGMMPITSVNPNRATRKDPNLEQSEFGEEGHGIIQPMEFEALRDLESGPPTQMASRVSGVPVIWNRVSLP